MMPAKRAANGNSKKADSKSPPSNRQILVTAAEGQTGRLILELLSTDANYSDKYAGLTALVFSEEAKASVEEEGFSAVKILVYDPKDETAFVEAMEAVDTCLLIPPARKVSTSSEEAVRDAHFHCRTRRRSRKRC